MQVSFCYTVTIYSLFRMLSCNQTSEKPYSFRIGNLILNSIGQLLPHQVQAFHTRDSVYPVGFSTTRIYWSMRVVGRRCRYQCQVKDVNGDPYFVVKVEEEGYDEVSFDARTPRGKFVSYPESYIPSSILYSFRCSDFLFIHHFPLAQQRGKV